MCMPYVSSFLLCAQIVADAKSLGQQMDVFEVVKVAEVSCA